MFKVIIKKNHDRNYDKLFKLFGSKKLSVSQYHNEKEYEDGTDYVVEFSKLHESVIPDIKLLKDVELIETN